LNNETTVVSFFLQLVALGHNRQDGRDGSAIYSESPASYRAKVQTFLWLGWRSWNKLVEIDTLVETAEKSKLGSS
jgi:hypothetical protein